MKDPRSIDGKIVQRYATQRRKKCSTCRYEENIGPIYICGYMDLTEERRGCPPGDGCKRYERVQVQRKPPRPPQPTTAARITRTSPSWAIAGIAATAAARLPVLMKSLRVIFLFSPLSPLVEIKWLSRRFAALSG